MSNHYQIELEQHPIELYKLLKIANLVSGGGEAKVLISNGHVLLNGELEIQKRKKVYSGDIIEFNNDLIELICHSQPIEKTTRTKNKTTEKTLSQKNTSYKKTKASKHDKIDTTPNSISNGQRRKITFE